MNSDCSSESNNDSNLIEYFKQKKDFNFVNTDNKNLIKIITNIVIPENIRFIGNIIDTQLYIWQETKHNIFLCGIKNSPIKSWYKIKSETELNILRDAFSKNEFSKNDKTDIMNSRFLLYSTQVADFDTLINYIINSEFIKDLNVFSNPHIK